MDEKKNFLLQEIIDDLVDTDRSLSKPLIKLLYFGRLIKNYELIEYVSKELNGYSDIVEGDNISYDKIPDYRKTSSTFYIDLQFGSHQHNRLDYPISALHKDLQFMKEFILPQGISQLEKLIINNEEGDIGVQLPMETFCYFQETAERLYKNPYCKARVIGVRMTCNRNFITSIPNNIRTRLLDFVMKIAEEFGYDIEINKFNEDKKNNQMIVKNMNNIINNSGDGNVINMGNNNQNKNNVSIYKGNLERLKKELSKLGIENEDIEEISKIVQEESLDDEGGLGEKSKSWIKKILGKVVDGASSISENVSVELLSNILRDFLGV